MFHCYLQGGMTYHLEITDEVVEKSAGIDVFGTYEVEIGLETLGVFGMCKY